MPGLSAGMLGAAASTLSRIAGLQQGERDRRDALLARGQNQMQGGLDRLVRSEQQKKENTRRDALLGIEHERLALDKDELAFDRSASQSDAAQDRMRQNALSNYGDTLGIENLGLLSPGVQQAAVFGAQKRQAATAAAPQQAQRGFASMGLLGMAPSSNAGSPAGVPMGALQTGMRGNQMAMGLGSKDGQAFAGKAITAQGRVQEAGIDAGAKMAEAQRTEGIAGLLGNLRAGAASGTVTRETLPEIMRRLGPGAAVALGSERGAGVFTEIAKREMTDRKAAEDKLAAARHEAAEGRSQTRVELAEREMAIREEKHQAWKEKHASSLSELDKEKLDFIEKAWVNTKAAIRKINSELSRENVGDVERLEEELRKANEDLERLEEQRETMLGPMGTAGALRGLTQIPGGSLLPPGVAAPAPPSRVPFPAVESLGNLSNAELEAIANGR